MAALLVLPSSLGLLAALAPAPPAPPPPPPAVYVRQSPGPSAPRPSAPALLLQGQTIRINGRDQRARWQWRGASPGAKPELWIPLEVLQDQLGVASRTDSGGMLELEWFGQRLHVDGAGQRSLDDELAVSTLELLQAVGVQVEPSADRLSLTLPLARLEGIRSRQLAEGRRIVLDLNGPALVQPGGGRFLAGVASTTPQRRQLQDLGLRVEARPDGLVVEAPEPEPRWLSLAGPYRLVFDLRGAAVAAPGVPPGTPGGTTTETTSPPGAPVSPSSQDLQALIGRDLQLQRTVLAVGGQRVRLHSVRLDPLTAPFDLRPLNRPEGMEGLSTLGQLAQRERALVAINGGFFNRVRRLPLGALKDDGRWLSGPILNRGAMGWRDGNLPQFDRLMLEEWLRDASGQRWPLTTLNSGYVQRGLARYTSAWGQGYRALSGNEAGLVLRAGAVVALYEPDQLEAGVPLPEADTLVVARGGQALPWGPGERLQLESRSSSPVGLNPYVIGGGPLLLQNGQLVLNGSAEGFSAGFLGQGAPRTVVASDGSQLWLVTLEGLDDAGPTLLQTALLLRQLGLRDALNLDGGSSTGLVVAGNHTVRGRGVIAGIHNGVGLVPRRPGPMAQRSLGGLAHGQP